MKKMSLIARMAGIRSHAQYQHTKRKARERLDELWHEYAKCGTDTCRAARILAEIATAEHELDFSI